MHGAYSITDRRSCMEPVNFRDKIEKKAEMYGIISVIIWFAVIALAGWIHVLEVKVTALICLLILEMYMISRFIFYIEKLKVREKRLRRYVQAIT